MDLQFIGNSIKQNRKNLNLTQEKLAELVDVSTHYIYELERGIKIPSLTMLISLAEIFNTTVDSLLTDSKTEIQKSDDELTTLINSLLPSKRKKLYEILCGLMPYLKL